ncbi:MAG: AMP-binding protein [Opitutaceae bacterium]|nr:AMP-binding protein [Opitutaceae bacterium]
MERVDLIRLLGAEPMLAEPRDVVVEAREPEAFMDKFTEAVAAGGTVFLADPAWGDAERAQFNALVAKKTEEVGHGWLCIPTGGSSGAIKLARHDEETLSAAVNGFCGHFGVKKVNAVGVLPLHHVSGFMAWMRTVLTGGKYISANWRAVETGARPALPVGEGDWFLSLVPTQLQRLLGDLEAEDWLRGFRAIFIGGAPAWPALIEAGAAARLPLAFSYGMTETAAMVAVLRPEEFLAGGQGSGAPLPHARVSLGEEGRIVIEGASLFRGYWPDMRAVGSWSTEDLGSFDERGSLHVLGRRDALIITGGEKVDPAEVERVLRGTGQFDDVAVIGVPDTRWGEAVVACYPAEFAPLDMEAVERVLGSHLAGFKHPKRYVAIARWPRNAQGKVNRVELRRFAD